MTRSRTENRVCEILRDHGGSQAPLCYEYMELFRNRITEAPGSTSNHQAWPGGYLDHVLQTMQVAHMLWGALGEAIALAGGQHHFTLADALVVLFFHDAEKPFRIRLGMGVEINYLNSFPKRDSDGFRAGLLTAAGIWDRLTCLQREALRYVEGEKDDYSAGSRAMSPLAAFCHMCDVASSRIFHNQGAFL